MKHEEFLRKKGCEIDLIEYSARYLSSILEAMELFRENVEHITSSSLSDVDVFENELDRKLKNSGCETEHQQVSFSQQRERALMGQIRNKIKKIEFLQDKSSLSPSLAGGFKFNLNESEEIQIDVFSLFGDNNGYVYCS